MNNGKSESRRRYLTVGIDISGRDCLVVGGGNVGTRKARTLLEYGGKVTVLAPEVSETVKELVGEGALEWEAVSYSKNFLEGRFLVVAATNDRKLNLKIAADAKQRGVLAILASPKESSPAIFTALYATGNLSVAVHTNGCDCKLSQKVRDEIARVINLTPPANGMKR
ncbi:MAG: hypothetical protein Kow0090_01830 [Myxococcota bacterium]